MNSFGKHLLSLKSSFSSLLIVTLLLLVGCAPPTQEVRDIYWPSPPDIPRIRYEGSFSNLRDIAGLSAKEIILGAGSSPVGGKFVKPFGLYVDKKDRLFITDTVRATVELFDFEKGTATRIGGRLIDFDNPMSVGTDASGKIYVTDSMRDKIYVFDEEANFLTLYGKEGELERPVGLAINDELERIYVADVRKHHVAVFDLKNGKLLFNISKRGPDDGELNMPSFIKLDQKGNLYVTDFNGRLSIFDADGNFIRKIGRYGDQVGEFARPKGIAFDTEGHIYVADAAFNKVQIFDQEGRVLMAFSGFGEKPGKMILPAGIAIDSKNRIYVTDQWNQRINIFQFLDDRYKKEHPEVWGRLTKPLSGFTQEYDTE